MKKAGALVCLLLGGCSTAPVADLLDWIKPGQLQPDPKFLPTGGVCQPPGPMLNAPVVPVPAGGAVVVPPTGASVIPPPAPFPSSGGAPAVPSFPGQTAPPPPPPPPNF
jgi:hypothetical protein